MADELTDEVEATLLTTAHEAHDALAGGVGLAAAARDATRFPSLCRLHAGIGDALEMSLTPELDDWLADARRSAERLEALREGLVPLAAHGAPLEAALARFLLFEMVRARLLVAAWATDTAFEAAGGVAEDVDGIAAGEVARLVAAWPALEAAGGGVRSFQLVLASAMVELTRHAEELRSSLARAQGEVVASFAERAAIEERLRELEPVDALLIRNELAKYLGEERVTVDELMRRHPVLLGGYQRDALDQRISRFRRKLRKGGLAAIRTRGAPSLAEVLSEE
jgi:hypothetical protein